MPAATALSTRLSNEIEIASLRRKWFAARRPGMSLPPYEEIVLGSLGRIADRLLIVGHEPPTSFRVLIAGRRIPDWVGSDPLGRRLEDLSANGSDTIPDVLAQALREGEPVLSRARRVRDGMVEMCEVLALPMRNRWGEPIVGAYMRETGIQHNLVDTIFRSTEDGILALTATCGRDGTTTDFQVVAHNEAAARLMRLPGAELQWKHLSGLQDRFNVLEFVDELIAIKRASKHGRFKFTLRGPAGAIHLRVGVAAIGDLLAATLTDIGEIKEREASFRLLFDSNPVPMWVYDIDTLEFIAVNDATISHYGYSRAQFQGMKLLDLWPRDEWTLHADVARSVHGSYESGRTWRHVRADGSEIEVLTYAQTLDFGQTKGVLVAIIDVTERRQAEARIAYMAHHDALTGLANRVLFNQNLKEALTHVHQRGEGLAVHFLDLDHFKSVNDSLGHPVGDVLLKAAADRLAGCLRASDTIARLGGDEFAVIQSPLDAPDEAGELAGRLIAAASERFEISGHEIVIGASIGIAVSPGDGDSAEALLRNADMAMYRAKSEGRGTSHFFEPEMDRRMQARRLLELDLRRALITNQFELHYQPLVNLRSEELTGFEALLRWRHPERGMVAPAEFIPLCEEIGLIVPIGEWVLREACRQAAAWPHDIKVAVNLSSIQFRNRGVIEAVMSALAYSRLAPARLELEITESVLLGETEANLATLHRLRQIGVRISMDDFGTGYSSLSYLRSFPFDKIKIDRSFVRELTERPDCIAIIRAVTGLGQSLGIATTAEGVETTEQLMRLREEGCTEVQGFLFSAPRPASELAALIESRGRRQTAA